MEQSGLSPVTCWRFRKRGWLATVVIANRHYVTREALAEFNKRAAAGEFAGTLSNPSTARLARRRNEIPPHSRRGSTTHPTGRIDAEFPSAVFYPPAATKRPPGLRLGVATVVSIVHWQPGFDTMGSTSTKFSVKAILRSSSNRRPGKSWRMRSFTFADTKALPSQAGVSKPPSSIRDPKHLARMVGRCRHAKRLFKS